MLKPKAERKRENRLSFDKAAHVSCMDNLVSALRLWIGLIRIQLNEVKYSDMRLKLHKLMYFQTFSKMIT